MGTFLDVKTKVLIMRGSIMSYRENQSVILSLKFKLAIYLLEYMIMHDLKME